MNLFLLAADPRTAARWHCDKHVVKMILEICQLLYTAWHQSRTPFVWSDVCPHAPYRPTHRNHPVAHWIRQRAEHYVWACALGAALCEEYTRRYEKTHKCESHLQRLRDMGFPPHMHDETYTPPVKKHASQGCPRDCVTFECALPDTCVVRTGDQVDAIKSYQKYYGTKHWVMTWNRGKDPAPPWYKHCPVPAPVKRKRVTVKTSRAKKKVRV